MKCLIAAEKQAASALKDLMGNMGTYQVTACQTAGEVRRLLMVQEFDLVLINTPLPDDTGVGLAEDICEGYDSGVILLVKAEMADILQEKVEDSGVFVVPKPVSKQVLFTALKFVAAARRRLIEAQKKQAELKRSIEDLRYVSKAKCLLAQLGLSEEEAHKRIERDAMNRRLTRRQVAEEIIDAAKGGTLQ